MPAPAGRVQLARLIPTRVRTATVLGSAPGAHCGFGRRALAACHYAASWHNCGFGRRISFKEKRNI
eukprot:548895-Hanusia_phi.AAC.2